ncbi:MAG: hypothetical protein ABSB78_08025 [Bacteroidota bacterium]
MNRLFVNITGIMLCVTTGMAQQTSPTRFEEQPADSLMAIRNQSLIGFERNLNTYLWTGRLALQKNYGDFSLEVNDLYHSSTIIATQKFVKDEQSLNALFSQKLSTAFSARLLASSIVLSDNRNLGISEVSSHQLLGGVELHPYDLVEISPMLGVRYDNQLGINNQGFSYQVNGRISDLDLSGYRMNFLGKYSGDDISPRKGTSNLASLVITKVFSDQAWNKLRFQFLQNRRDFYFNADTLTQLQYNVTSNIDSRRENIFAVSEELTYHLSDVSALTFGTDISNRLVSRVTVYKNFLYPSSSIFDADVGEFRLETLLQFLYTNQNSNAMMRLTYAERDERHTAENIESVEKNFYDMRRREEEKKDNSSRKISLAGSGSFPLSSSDRIETSFSTSLLQYDTPSLENVDDRDELLIVAGIAEERVWSPSLRVRVNADVVLNHMVYLLSQRSANNNWNRIIRLAPRIYYSPASWFHTINVFEVLANYTVYDFEEEVKSVKSYSFRQFSWLDSTAVQVTQRIWIDGVVLWKFYERGQLFWKEFKERPANYFSERSLFTQMRYSAPGVTFAAGIRMFSQKRYNSQGDARELEGSILNIGPTCMIDWMFSRTGMLSLNGWYEIQYQTDVTTLTYSNLTMRVTFTL